MNPFALLITVASLASLPAAGDPPSARLDLGPAIQRFVLDSAQSIVGFDGSSTLHDFEGRCETVSGELRVDPDNMEQTAGGTFSIAVHDLSTDNEGRDEEMYEAMEVETHPRIEFELESVERDAQGQMSGLGHFRIHGVSRARHFPFELTPTSTGGWHARGGVNFNITDHGITPPSKIVVGMYDEVRVWFDLTYVPAPVTRVDAVAHDVSLTESTELLGGETTSSSSKATIWSDAQRTLFEHGSAWTLAGPTGVTQIDPQHGSTVSLGATAEPAFAESRALVSKLQQKLDELSGTRLEKLGPKLRDSIARTSESLAFAPPPGPAEVVREGDRVRILLGGELWAQLTGLSGDAPFPAALAGKEGVAAEVRAALNDLRGVPSAFELRVVHPTRRVIWSGTVSVARDVSAPTWILDAGFWSDPADD